MTSPRANYGITRIDQPDKKNHGYYVRITHRETTLQKYFPDASSGGKAKALKLAKAYRDEALAAIQAPKISEHAVEKPLKTGLSGITHVISSVGENKKYQYWRAEWLDEFGQLRTAKFSINRYGKETALALAIKARTTGKAGKTVAQDDPKEQAEPNAGKKDGETETGSPIAIKLEERDTIDEKSGTISSFFLDIVLSGELPIDVAAVEKELRRISQSDAVTVLEVESGSIIITLDVPKEAAELLERLYRTGQLTELLKFPIRNIDVVEPSDVISAAETGVIMSMANSAGEVDIFVSYCRKDLERVEPIVQRLKTNGWSVFFDQQLVGGDDWRKVLAENLAKATLVLVVWTKESTQSSWVNDEADDAKSRGTYFPVLLDKVKVPLGFRNIHHVNLCPWAGAPDAKEISQLLIEIDARIVSSGRTKQA